MTADELVERVAQRVVEVLRADGLVAGGERLVDAQAVADALGVSREYVYDHKRELGGVPVGDGPRPRWWFDLAVVGQRLASRSAGERAPGRDSPGGAGDLSHRARRRSGDGVELLPIRDGKRAA